MNYSKLVGLLFALALPRAVLAQGNEAARPDPEVAKAVTKVAHEMSAALTKPDLEAAARMLADSYYAVTPDGGTVTKSQFLADLKSGKFRLETNQLDDMKVHATTPDLAIVTYRSTDKGSFDGQDISGHTVGSMSWRNATAPGNSSSPKAPKSKHQRSRRGTAPT